MFNELALAENEGPVIIRNVSNCTGLGFLNMSLLQKGMFPALHQL